jgi:hypothetical protein
MQQRTYEFDGKWDWLLKKEGREDALKDLLRQDKP